MGTSPSKSKGKPMKPSRVESAREAPKWLAETAHGDVFALTPVGSHVDDGSAFDTEYVSDKWDNRKTQLDPIGILTSVRDVSANENPRVEYTYTWPEPTRGPLVALAGIWHCTQFTATVDYRDEKARNRVSTVVMHSSSKRRAFRLTHALELGGELSWSALQDRIKEALNWNVGADGYKKGKSVWQKWLATRPKEERGLFKTADDTVNVMVKYIRGYVDQGPVQKAAEALARRTSRSALPAKEKRREPVSGGAKEPAPDARAAQNEGAKQARKFDEVIKSAFSDAVSDLNKIAKGGTPAGPGVENLGWLFERHDVQIRGALEGLELMARDFPYQVVEFLQCFVYAIENDNGSVQSDDFGYRKLLRLCKKHDGPMWQSWVFKETAQALLELAAASRKETMEYFSSFLSL